MKTPVQPTLPGVRDYREPITVNGAELKAIIAEAEAAGFYPFRMTVKTHSAYELQFLRLPANATR